MMDKWIVKKVEYDNTMLQLECPYCGGEGEVFFVHKEGPKPNYCTSCGCRLVMDDADKHNKED